MKKKIAMHILKEPQESDLRLNVWTVISDFAEEKHSNCPTNASFAIMHTYKHNQLLTSSQNICKLSCQSNKLS